MTPRSPTTGCDSRDDRPSRHGVALPLRERERVALGEEHLGAALESRDTSLAEHGETTLALLHVEGERRAWKRNDPRDQLIPPGRGASGG